MVGRVNVGTRLERAIGEAKLVRRVCRTHGRIVVGREVPADSGSGKDAVCLWSFSAVVVRLAHDEGASAGAAGGPNGGSGGVGGSGQTSPDFSFFIGADVTDQEVAPDATRATLLSIMKSHGFNFIRLARPDMVQIGNETTPGMLIHRCDSGGQPTGNNPITGSTSNWSNLGALLKAGVDAVREVDPTILVSFHIDKGGDKASEQQGSALQTSINWITSALKYASFDAFGESCYQRYQGDPNSTTNTKAGWTNTFTGLATKFPGLKFFAAEYGPMEREINDVLYGLPAQKGIGTFNWEPTTQGDWNTGHDLLRRSGSTYNAQPDLALYDAMMTAYADRL